MRCPCTRHEGVRRTWGVAPREHTWTSHVCASLYHWWSFINVCVCVCVCDARNVCASACFACFHKKLHNFRRFCSFLTSSDAFDNIRYRTLLLDPLTLFLGSGARDGAFGSGTALQAGKARVRFPFVSLEFFVDVILPAAIWSWGRLTL